MPYRDGRENRTHPGELIVIGSSDLVSLSLHRRALDHQEAKICNHTSLIALPHHGVSLLSEMIHTTWITPLTTTFCQACQAS
jgi:hypothetical protein